MKKALLISVLVLAAIVAFWLMSAKDMTDSASDMPLPWNITSTASGGIEVFGIEPGVTTLQQAAAQLGAEPEIALFSSPEGELSLQGYLGLLSIGPIQARIVMPLVTEDVDLAAFSQRHVSSEARPSGSVRLRLAAADFDQSLSLPIAQIVYLPVVNIDRDSLQARFGNPAEIRELKAGEELWLYPQKGLVLHYFEEDKEVLHYVHPEQFSQLVEQLKNQTDFAAE